MTLDDVLRRAADALPAGAGPLGLLSGDEFLDGAAAFDHRLLELTGMDVGVIYCADHRAQRNSERFASKHFAKLGARAFTLDMHADELPPFDLAYIAGGSPKTLVEHLRESTTFASVLQRWRDGAGLAGSSAGAMALCTNMLVPEEGARVPTTWTTGVGQVEGMAIAAHASSRARAWLEQIARSAPVPVVALGDSSGVILRHGYESETYGPNDVWIV
jgi:hypothetical protein